MSISALHDLAETVQYNCHISDARHGADDSLCIYLMRMREYFRWEQRLPFGAPLERERVGEWLQAREQLWEELEQAEWRPIEIDGRSYDPFDTETINTQLAPRGLVYSGGLGHRAKPHFVLGDLERQQRTADRSIFVVAGEYARDLTAPPAMTLGHSLFVRRESLRRLLWEKLESWRWNRPNNALGRAFACHDFDQALDDSLEAMTEREIRTLLLHEEGEYLAGQRLGEDWNRMLLDLAHTPAEIMARAVRDHLADCLVTLPVLTEDGATASLHFLIGNLSNMRREIFPSLWLAYEQWLTSQDPAVFMDIARQGRRHWEEVALGMLDRHRQGGAQAAEPIRELVISRCL
ncbi:Sfum_1244 family protein [Thiocystis violacea]|uniref:Sfum_1244 family protein n=1 Tax=Thiocystis violacea TaxID=13725 RepID=UPI0019088A9D|nr:Sfum_1244 family protein [Thiocystis violacea]MBK1719552.1 hypothetical protein [Thiocystis violacea]